MASYETYTDIPSTKREYGTGRKGGELSNNISKFPYSRLSNAVFEIQQNKFHEFLFAPRIPTEQSCINSTALVNIATSSTNTIVIPFRASTDNMNGFEISLAASHDGYGAGKLRAAVYELDMSSLASTTSQNFFKSGKILPTDEYVMDDSTSGTPWIDIDFGTTAGNKIVQSTGLHDGTNYPYVLNNDCQNLTVYSDSADLPNYNTANKPFMIEYHIGSYLSNPMRDLLLYDTTYGNSNVKAASSTDGNNIYCALGYNTMDDKDIAVQSNTGKRIGAKHNYIPAARIIPGRMYGLVLTCSETFSTTAGGTAQVTIYGTPKSVRGKRNTPYIYSAWNNRTWKGKGYFNGSTTRIMPIYAHGWVGDAAHSGVLPGTSDLYSAIHSTNPTFAFTCFSKEKCEVKSIRVSTDSGEKLTDSVLCVDIVQDYDGQRCNPLMTAINMPESFEYYDEFHNVAELEHPDLLRIRYKDGNHDVEHLHMSFQIDHKEVATFSQTYL